MDQDAMYIDIGRANYTPKEDLEDDGSGTGEEDDQDHGEDGASVRHLLTVIVDAPWGKDLEPIRVCDVCVYFLPNYYGRQVRWMYQPGSHRRKVTQDFSSTFLLRYMPLFFSREGFSRSFPSSTVKSNFVY